MFKMWWICISYKKMLSPIQNNQEWTEECFAGIDVPVLWVSDTVNYENTKGIVLLLAQDPLRDTDYWDKAYCKNIPSKEDLNKYVIVGTPYALHMSEAVKRATLKHGYKKRWNIKIYYNLISEIVNRGYSVYCTDVFKYYFRRHKYQIEEYDKNILRAEIEQLASINLSHIICMGTFAQKCFDEIKDEVQDSNILTINTPHPRARTKKWNDVLKGKNLGSEKITDEVKIKYILEKL